ncbi:MAG: transposase [Endomicrobium sp.]|nr:transposase [Endomicrobium sp.]
MGYGKLEEFKTKWNNKYKYVSDRWERNWTEFVTFWKYSVGIRKLIYTTPPLEAFNCSMRKVMKTRGMSPQIQCLV